MKIRENKMMRQEDVMHIKKQTKDLSILTLVFMIIAFAAIQRFDREVNELNEASHPLETFHAR